MRRFPDFAPAQKRLASLYAEDPEKRDQAYDLVIKARKALPDDPELAQILAELSYQRKEFAYAVQLLRRSSKKRPLDAKYLYYLGMSHLKADEKLESREALRQALAAGLPDPLASEAKSVLADLDKRVNGRPRANSLFREVSTCERQRSGARWAKRPYAALEPLLTGS